MGLGVRALLAYESSWVHRRVETFQFVDERTVRRQMSVDFKLPERNRIVDALFEMEGPFVPLTTLHKQPLGHLNVWADDGRPLPVLTSSENARLAGACLVAIGRGRVRRRRPGGRSDITPAVAEGLRQVAALPLDDARYLLGCMATHGDEKRSFQMKTWMDHCWDDWRPSEDLRALVAALDLHREVLDAALESPMLLTLLTEFATQFILAVAVDPEDVGRRQVIKFAYDESTAYGGTIQPFALRARRVVESLSYMPAQYNFTGLAIGKSASHHVEVVAPSQMEIMKVTLLGEAGSWDYSALVESTAVGERAHVNLAGAPRSASGTVTVAFRVERPGLLRAAPLLAALVLLALILLSHYAATVQNDAAAALLTGPRLSVHHG